MAYIGLDIGTSSITALVCDGNKHIIDCLSVDHHQRSAVSGKSFEALQSPDLIFDYVLQLLHDVIAAHTNIRGIGIANQMHGLLYINKDGDAVSPLYTWQDKRGDESIESDESYSARIFTTTSYKVPTGYGSATHYYNSHNSLVPQNAYKILDIGSYVGSRLSRTIIPTIHPSNAHAFGLYDMRSMEFDARAIQALGLEISLYPNVIENQEPLGTWQGIPIYEPIGDNQAGVFGCIGMDLTSIAINLGTSGQLSFLAESDLSALSIEDLFEERPFVEDLRLYVACSLCGGKTLDIWSNFLFDVLDTFSEHKEDREAVVQKIYSYLTTLPLSEVPQDSPEKHHRSLTVKPYFYASRHKPGEYASILQLTDKNFNTRDISVAMIKGMVDELAGYWEVLPQEFRLKKKNMYFTGGATRIPSLAHYLSQRFHHQTPNRLQKVHETAFGAALWSMYRQGVSL